MTAANTLTLTAPMVLHVRVVAGSGGGPDKTILRSARYAGPGHLRMAAAYIHPRGDQGIAVLREQAREFDCPFYEIPETGPADPGTALALLRLCRQLRVRVWHGHDYKSNLLGLVLARFWPMKLVTTVHGWTRETRRTRLYYHVDRWCLPRYEQVVAVSPLLAQQCTEAGVLAERLTYVPNGVDLAEYPRGGDRTAAREELGIAADRFVIGVVGRLSPEKGVDRAIRTLAALHDKYPHVELHLIGDGPERGNLEILVQELGLTAHVRFWGWQTSSQCFYRAMDLLLLPSHTEGLPNVVLEAMAMGVPVAATEVGGVNELLDAGRCGVLLTQDAATWRYAIAPLLVSADRRAEFARRARRRIEAHYSFDQRMAREMAIYDRVLGVERSPAATPARRAA